MDNERLLRRKPLPADAFFHEFDLPPLTHPVSPSRSATNPTASEPITSRTHHESQGHASRERLCWKPFFLKRKTLLCFIAVFASCFAALAVLFGYSQSHQGVSTAEERLYYIWTYGPTAVLSLLAAFWVQVVYRTRQLMPWKSMATTPQTASKSVLLDYISPIGVVALLRAISNSHFVVSLSIVSSFTMLAMTVSSTGLFTLQRVEITSQNVSLLAHNKFSFVDFDWASTDSRPTEIVYATSILGLKFPAGTTAQYAVQDFSASLGSNKTLLSTVDVFSTHLECTPATLTLASVVEWAPHGHLFHSGATFITNVSSPDCTVIDFEITSGTVLDSNTPYNGTLPNEWGYGQVARCVEDSSVRILASVGNYVINERWNGTEFDPNIGLALPLDKMFTIVNSTNIICKPRYRIETAQVIKHMNSTSSSELTSIEPTGRETKNITDIQASKITRAVFQSISDPTTQSYFLNDSLSYNSFCRIMQIRGAPGVSDASQDQFWHEAENLERGTTSLYSSLAAQVAALKLLSPANNTVQGQVIETRPRLFVRTLSFALIEAGFVILVAIALRLLALASGLGLSHDPGSLDGLATILSGSPEFTEQIGGLGNLGQHHFDTALRGHVYNVGYHGGIVCSDGINESIRAGVDKENTAERARRNSQSKQFWQPSILRISIRVLVVLIPLFYIVILEILLTFSRSHEGVVSIDTNSWLHYGWTYIPALLMVIVGVAYDSVNESIKMINPYANMYRRSVPSIISIQDHPLSRISLHDLFISGKHRQVAVFGTTIGVFLASLLPIAVSGLYAPTNHKQSINVHPLTGWNFNGGKNSNYTILNNTFVSMNESYPGDPEDAYALPISTSLIVTANLSYPSRSYGELAFPLLDARIEGPSASTTLSGSVDVTIPAIRGALNCTLVPHGKIKLAYETNYSSYGGIGLIGGNRQSLNITLETGSPMPNPSDDSRFAIFSLTDESWFGGCTIGPMIIFLPHSGAASQPYGTFSKVQNLVNHTYCPLYAGMIGTASATSINQYSFFACSTEVERVNAQTTLALPDYTILDASADESSAIRLPGNATDEFWYADTRSDNWSLTFTGPNSALYGDNLPVDPNRFLAFYNMTDSQNYDNFFSCLVYGRDGVPFGEIVGEANAKRLLAAVQHLWRVVYAQQFASSTTYMSADPEDVKAWAPNGPWNGTLLDPNSYRLKQSVISTRILQGTLAALALCGIIAFVAIGSTSRLLPNNPSSIAVAASLLAGSELLKVVQKRESEEGESQAQKGDPWAGYLFSMGWWDRDDGGRRFGVDIGKADPAE